MSLTFWEFYQVHFLRFCCKFSMKTIFGICLYDCFIHRSNFVLRKCLEARRHLGFGPKTVNSQGYSELGFQSKRAKSAVH